MSILSWLGIRQRFMRRGALDEFNRFVREEKVRQRGTDGYFDEGQFDRAAELVRERLQKRKHKP